MKAAAIVLATAPPPVPQFTAGDLKGVLVVAFLILGGIWLLRGMRQ